MLTYTTDGPIAWVVIDRPERMNAMPRPFWARLREVVAAADADPDVRVVVFRGEGRCFSVGGDIEGFAEIGDTADRRAYLDDAMAAFRAVENASVATIAAVHGYALGGGCELTLVCDIVVADETARFGMPESAVGLVPGLGVVRGRAHLNLHWMKYLVLTGESLGAQDARLAGLVNEVVPEGGHVARAEELARKVAGKAPLAVQVGKRILGRDRDEGYGYGVEAIALLQGTADHAEGIAAFGERRTPQFEGR
ncbi:MAG: enoyl-CoA hydratase/isomerase family protein [Solirubrobacteraceae bacterium]|nr:enoyl-CoA hydratase/isomerase family protein [Solirubrobacteraceae bacterium]